MGVTDINLNLALASVRLSEPNHWDASDFPKAEVTCWAGSWLREQLHEVANHTPCPQAAKLPEGINMAVP